MFLHVISLFTTCQYSFSSKELVGYCSGLDPNINGIRSYLIGFWNTTFFMLNPLLLILFRKPCLYYKVLQSHANAICSNYNRMIETKSNNNRVIQSVLVPPYHIFITPNLYDTADSIDMYFVN